MPKSPTMRQPSDAAVAHGPDNSGEFDDLLQQLLEGEGGDDDGYTSFPSRDEREAASYHDVMRGDSTWERYIVENYLRHYKWYNPNRDNPRAPSLLKGWHFFEYFTLPRHFTEAEDEDKTVHMDRDNDSSTTSRPFYGPGQSEKSIPPALDPPETPASKGNKKVKKEVSNWIKAPPGDTKSHTSLYPLGTPLEALGDWGIGVGMYFSTLAAMTVIFLMAGLLNIKNMLFYASKEYDPDRFDPEKGGFPLMATLKLSTVCMTREWVVCLDCDSHTEYWDNIFAKQYYGKATDPETGEVHTVIQRTTCEGAEFEQGIWNMATIVFLILSISAFVWYQSKIEVRMDEGMTTASDYSVLVSNPPEDALDPEEWRSFFEKVLEKAEEDKKSATRGTEDEEEEEEEEEGKAENTSEKKETKREKSVTLCTIALNNHSLLDKLIQRRKDLKKLQNLLWQTVELQNMNDGEAVEAAVTQFIEDEEIAARIRAERHKTCFSRISACLLFPFHVVGSSLKYLGNILGVLPMTPLQLWVHIQKQTAIIREMQENEVYQATAVYVTFETEQAQRTVLSCLNAGRLELWSNKRIHMPRYALFRGNVVLEIQESDEPDTVRWTDLGYTDFQVILRRLQTFFVTCVMITISVITLPLIRVKVSVLMYSIILSLYNSLIPIIVKTVVALEKHPDEGDMHQSLYINIALFRWVNTVIVTDITTPFLAKIGSEKIDMLSAVNGLLISEMFTSPILKFLDIGGFMQKHIFAPRSKSQDEMNQCFIGSWFNLAERFTDFTKVLLLCIFYSPYYPLVFFFGAGILFVQYWSDKYMLLRAWQRCPMVGPETSIFSRRYFSTAAIVIGACSAGFAYSHFPYTNLCDCGYGRNECDVSEVSQEYENVQLLNGTYLDEIKTSSTPAKFCHQENVGFPPLPKNQWPYQWMTESQEDLTKIYGWFAFSLFLLYLVAVFGHRITNFVVSLWKGLYEPSGIDQQKDFTNGIGIDSFAYVPQLSHPSFNLPFLASNVDNIDVNLIGWNTTNDDKDLHRRYDNFNLIYDVPLSDGMVLDRPVFSIIKQWPPDWALESKNGGTD